MKLAFIDKADQSLVRKLDFTEIEKVLVNGKELDTIDFMKPQKTLTIVIETSGSTQISLDCHSHED